MGASIAVKYLKCFALLLVAFAGCGDPNRGLSGRGLLAAGEIADIDPFDESMLANYDLSMNPADWNAIVANPFDSTWRNCTLTWQGEVYYDMVVRPHGRSANAAGNPKPSLRIKFNYYIPHRKFHSIYVSGVILDGDHEDPSMMRKRIEYGVYRSTGMPAPRCVNCTVSINGQSIGVYQVEERMKRGFIKEHFGSTNMNQLYDWDVQHPNDVIWLGWDPASQYTTNYFVPKLKKLDPLNPDAILPESEIIREFVASANLDPWDVMSQKIDVETFYRFMAGEVLTGEGDSYVAFRQADPSNGYRSANFRVYKNQISGQHEMLAWDRDQGYWTPRDSVTMGFDQRILTNKIILSNPAALARYKQILGELVRGPASTAAMNARIDFIYNQIINAAFADNFKSAGSNLNWLAHVQTIRNYIAQHNAMILSQTP